MKIYIRNMVSIRCTMMVKSILKKHGLHYSNIILGEVELAEDISKEQTDRLKIALRKTGLELMDDKKSKLVEKIKLIIIELVHYSDGETKVNLPDYLSKKLNRNYAYLARLFSEVKGITIEQFYLNHKIEKVKELILFDDLSLTEIAHRLNYTSVAHLSNQFKKITGLSPRDFKQLRPIKESLESI